MKITISCNEFYFRDDLDWKDKNDLLDVIAKKLDLNDWPQIRRKYDQFPATALWVIADCNITQFMKMQAISELFLPYDVELEFTDIPQSNYN